MIASEEGVNLRGTAKAEALCRRFGKGGFVYLGNDSTDHAVWDVAGGAVLVNGPRRVEKELRNRDPKALVLRDHGNRWRASLRAMRPHQWVKNALCFVPLIAARDVLDPAAWLAAIAVASAFCLIASGIYLLNDISDLAADRAHLRKRSRPFASGELPIAVGLALSPVLILAGLTVATLGGVVLPLGLYLAGSLAYNFWLKEQPLADIFMLAGLYTLRIFGGGEATGHRVSLWLLGFSLFLFLSLALVKRVSELHVHRKRGLPEKLERRGYRREDLEVLQTFGCAASFASIILLSLYVQSDTASQAYAHPMMLWGASPLLLFWQCRLWLSAARGWMHDDPIIFAARDRVSWAVFACLVSVVGAAWLPAISWPGI